METYGYTRVSTREQNDERQRAALREAGVKSGHIYAGRNAQNPLSRFVLLSDFLFSSLLYNI